MHHQTIVNHLHETHTQMNLQSNIPKARFMLPWALKSDPRWIAFQSMAKQLLSGFQEEILSLPECHSFLYFFFYQMEVYNGANVA